jgi:hypothetical protein
MFFFMKKMKTDKSEKWKEVSNDLSLEQRAD